MSTSHSPVNFVFHRSGGTDIRSQIQIWVRKNTFTALDRPVAIIDFQQPTQAMEAANRGLAPGQYICVHLVMVREALNGLFAYSLSVANTITDQNQGDVNQTPAQNDIKSFRLNFPLDVLS